MNELELRQFEFDRFILNYKNFIIFLDKYGFEIVNRSAYKITLRKSVYTSVGHNDLSIEVIQEWKDFLHDLVLATDIEKIKDWMNVEKGDRIRVFLSLEKSMEELEEKNYRKAVQEIRDYRYDLEEDL